MTPDELNDIVQRWMIKAHRDLRSAHNDLKDRPPITDIASFHCQQCVEKCLKAVLASHAKHINKSHFLPLLLEECVVVEPSLAQFSTITNYLFSYAVATRYPDDWREISLEEATQAFQYAKIVYDQIMKLLHDRGFGQPILNLEHKLPPSGILSELEKDTIRKILQQTGGNISQAAKILGIARGTLYKKMEEHGLK